MLEIWKAASLILKASLLSMLGEEGECKMKLSHLVTPEVEGVSENDWESDGAESSSDGNSSMAMLSRERMIHLRVPLLPRHPGTWRKVI